jgi:tetratricopeptide (TPR) repeat protein
VAQTIAREINAVINPEEIRRIETIPTGNLTAYDLYLQAEEEWKTYIRSEDTIHIDRALRLYQQALSIDSTFAEAYIGLANVYMSGIPDQEFYFKNMGIDSALTLVEYALSLNPESDEAYLYLGLIYASALGKPEQAREYLDKVITMNPSNAQGYLVLGYLDFWEDNMQEAILNFYKSYKLDETFWKPMNLGALGVCYERSGFFDMADFYYKEKLKLDYDSLEYLESMINMEGMRGNISESYNLAEQLFQKDSGEIWALKTMIEICISNNEKSKALHYAVLADSLIIKEDLIALNYSQRIGHAYWLNGFNDRAQYYFNKQLNNCLESIKLQRTYALQKWAYYDLAGIYAFLGEKEKAYEALEEYNTKKSESAIIPFWMKTDPLFNSIREEERFQRIYRDIKAKYQREHDKLKAWMEEEGII